MKKSIKIFFGILGGLFALSLLFLSVGLISFGETNTEENKTILIIDETNITESNCIILKESGKMACLILKNISLSGGQLKNLNLTIQK